MARLKVEGIEQARAKLRVIAQKFPNAIEKAMYQEMSIELTEMKRRTPVDTGALRASGHILPPVRQGRRISVSVRFGGIAPYAVHVHEDLFAFHRVGQAKFVESVINESVPFMTNRVADRIDINSMI